MKKIANKFIILALLIIVAIISNNNFINNKTVFVNKTAKANYVAPNASGTELVADVEFINFGNLVRSFSAEEADNLLVSITFTNAGTTRLTLNNTNPSEDGPFGCYWFDSEQILEPGDELVVRARPTESSPFATTAGEYAGTYVFTATNVENPEDTFVINIPATITLVEPTTWTVSFETYEGSSIDDQIVIDGTSIGIPEEPVWEDHLFLGWYADDTFNTEYNFEDPVTGDITLFAKWAVKRTITIDVNGGNELENNILYVPQGMYFYEVAELIDEPTHSDPLKYLGGVKINSLESEELTEEQLMSLTVEEDLTVYFIWREFTSLVDHIDINIDPYIAGRTSEMVYLEAEDRDVPSEVPNVRWNEEDRFGLFNPDYVAGTCYFDQCDTIFEGTFIQGYTYYAKLHFNTTEDYYGFATDIVSHISVTNGWVSEAFPTDRRTIDVIVAFVAQPEENRPPESSTITFDSNGGTEFDPITRDYGETEVLPTPVKDGFVFGGWELRDEEDHPCGIVMGGDIWDFEFDETLHALWYDENNQIEEINLEVDPLFIGNEVTIEDAWDEVGNYPYTVQIPGPVIEFPENSHYHIMSTRWVQGLCDEEHDDYSCYQDFSGNVLENTDYYVMIEIETDNDYFITDDIFNNITINGNEPEQTYDIYDMKYISFLAKVRSANEFYTVNIMDGENVFNTMNIRYKEHVEQPQENPSKANNANISYNFDGYYTDDTYNVPFDFNTEIKSDTNIYIKWDETINKTVNYYDGETLIATEYPYDRAYPLNPNPEKNGFTFDGWYADDTFNTQYDFSQNIDGDIINIYAKFVKNKQTINFAVTSTGTIINMVLNDTPIVTEEDNQDVTINRQIENVGYYDDNNTFRIVPRFGDHLLESVTINGTEYTDDNENVQVNADEWTIVVPGSEEYTVVAVADENSSVPRTIIWANTDANENADDYDEDMVIEHGSAKIIGVYNDNNIRVSGETDVDDDGMGYIVVEPGDNVIFEFTPEYGYQLTSILVNGQEVSAEAALNQYSFEMPDANVHFQAIFKKTDDIVASNTNKVSSGSIKLGGNLDGGSAKLTISDVELSQDKIKDFENKAGEDYTLKTYLDIDLYNIFYKGKDDANDVWSNKIDELDEYATITIKLADDVDVSNIVLVHNVHDGDKYEIIQIESYDAENHTITFKTKSFSNYAIAVKNTASTNTNTNSETNQTTNETNTTQASEEVVVPKTFDNISTYIILLLISVLGMCLSIKKLKKRT